MIPLSTEKPQGWFRRVRRWCTAITLGITLVTTTAQAAENFDPTTPSSMITERLNQLRGGHDPLPSKQGGESTAPPTISIRIKAIVLQDADHGMAMLVTSKDQTVTITLKRDQLRSPMNQWNIGGTTYAVENFSDSSVLLKSLPSGRLQVVN